ncbi:MAG: hypothetical protein WC515_08320 [Candidatus Omnitrophota bacterium]
MTLTRPNDASEIWRINTNQSITWTKQGNMSTVNVYYSTNNGTNWTKVNENPVDAAGGNYTWNLNSSTNASTQAKISVNYTADEANVSDSSENPFKVIRLTVTSPNNGTENWKANSTYKITWTSANIDYVNLYYSLNNGSSYTMIPGADNLTAGDSEFNWSIANNIMTSNNVLVLAEDTGNTSVNDTSNATFAIIPNLTITNPQNGIALIAEDPYNMTWTKTGNYTGNVKLEYSVNGNGTWVAINNSSSSNSPYTWTAVPGDILSEDCYVRITSLANANATDESNAGFYIRGNITVTSPNGDENLQVGNSSNITWTRKGNITTVNIYYSSNDGANWTQLKAGASSPNATGSWQWDMQLNTTTSTQCRINITDPNNEANTWDISNQTFSVIGRLELDNPTNASIVLSYPGYTNISWTRYGGISYVQVRYSNDSGETWPDGKIIAPNISATASPLNWTIPNDISAQLKVKVIDTGNANVTDDSNNTFSIKGGILLIAPNGNENWTVNTSQTIQWKTTGTYIQPILLQYSDNNGTNWTDIDTVMPGGDAEVKNLSWTIPNNISSEARVRAVTQENASTIDVLDGSNGTFKIIGNISLTQPNGGQTWYVNESREIRWNSKGTFPVRIEYSNDSGVSNWAVVNNTVTSYPGLNIYNWTVPDDNSELCIVKVSDNRTIFQSLVTSQSNATFSIRPVISVTQPVSGQNVVAHSGNTPIRWNYTGSTIANVKVQYSLTGTAPWTDIATVNVSNGSNYIWPEVPTTTSTTTKIRVYDVDNANVTNTSDGFNIVGSLMISSPNGGENWTAGSSRQIIWTRYAVSTLNISYSLNNASTWFNINNSFDTSTNTTCTWDIPTDLSVSNLTLIRIQDTSNPDNVSDASNATFNITPDLNILHPEYGDIFRAEDTHYITWSKTGTNLSYVKLEYSTNGGGSWSNVDANATVDNNANYTWVSVDGTILSDTCLIRISDPGKPEVNSTSNSSFSIKGKIILTRPVEAAENWKVGTNQSITWTKQGNMSAVNIYYSTNNGTNWTKINPSPVNCSGGSYTWTLNASTAASEAARISVNYTADEANVSGYSDNPFKVSKLMITTPNLGTENWKAGDTYEITWNASSINKVNVSYSINNGSSWIGIPGAQNISASNQSFNWTIANNTVTSNSALILIEDVSNTTINDTSNATYALIPNFTIIHPQNGDPLIAESSSSITWTKVGNYTGNVKLEYSTDGNATWLPINNSTSSNSPYSWTSVPGDVLSEDCYVRITSLNNANATDDSNSSFYIRGNITVTSPNGFENLQLGNSTNITWTKKGNITTVNIYYSYNNGTNWTQLQAGVNAATGSWQWDIDLNNVTICEGLGLVNITDANNEANTWDASNNTFTMLGKLILTYPSASDIVWTYTGTNTTNITWTKYGGIVNVNLTYDNSSGVTKIINSSTSAAAPKYMWTIPDDIGTNLIVRVMDTGNANVTDISDNPFAIKGSMQVLQPNGSENWTVNTSYAVQWKTKGSYIQPLLIQYSADNATWKGNYSVLAGVDNETKTYNWSVPDDIANTVKVRISTQENASSIDVTDSSDANFSIIGNVTVQSPDGNETWYYNETNNIQWLAKGTVTPVNISYSVNNGSGWTLINNTVTGSTGLNNYSWTVPDENSETCLIRVSDNRTIYKDLVTDDSNAVFKIRPYINMTQPVSGQNVIAHSANTAIRWTSTGTKIDNVSIQYTTNRGVNWTNIETVPVEYGANYTWQPRVPDVTCDNDTIIRAFDTVNNNVTCSTATFNIVGGLQVNDPAGGENWRIGSTSNIITWTSYAINLLNISYSKNNGSSWTNITNNYAANSSSYNWTIPNATIANNTVIVRVQDMANPSIVYSTSNQFNLTADFDITHPEYNDVVIANESYYITWTSKGLNTTDYVILQYSTNNGSNWSYVVPGGNNTTVNSGNYTWDPVPGGVLSNGCLIRITDTNNPNGYNTSNSSFIIRGNISVTRPNTGSEGWQVGDNENVNWTIKGNISLVDVYYSHNNGSNWTKVTPSPVNASNQTWTWPINLSTTTSTTALIKVAEYGNENNVSDISNNTFELRGRLNLLTPSSSGLVLSYNGSSVYNITWEKFGGMTKVRLRYSTDGGQTFPDPYIIQDNLSAGAGTHQWTIPNSIGYNLSVKVEDQDNVVVNDTSNNTFAIKGAMQLLAPNGNESWLKGTQQVAQWKPTGTYPGNVKLEYSNNSGANWSEFALKSAGTDNTTQNANWTIPDDITSTAMVRVITQTGNASIEVNDTSDDLFKIKGGILVTQPDGNETWYVGDTNRQIIWSATGTVNPVKIEYSTDNGGNWTDIPNSHNGTDGTNSFNWTPIPDKKSELCLVKVSDARVAFTGEVTDTSNQTFHINPVIVVTEPHTGQNVEVESGNTSINWTYTGNQLNKVNIDYSTNGGANWTNINTNITAGSGGNGSYTWPQVPVVRTSSAKIRIYDSTNSNITNMSGTFNIVGKLALGQPNGGTQNWEILSNSSSNVVWTAKAVETINIYYSVNGSAGPWNFSKSVSDASNVTSTSFDVPAIATNAARIKVTDSTNENVTSAMSDTDFRFVEKFDITYPENGITLVANSTIDINWTRKSPSAIPQVNLWFYNGTDYSIIAYNVSNNQRYTGWHVPDDVISDVCKIKIESPINANNSNESTPEFAIRGNVTITAPNNGTESWEVGQSYNISWSFVGPIQNITIMYSANGGTNWTEVVSRVPAGNYTNGTGSWSWFINNSTQLSTGARIMVYDPDQPLTEDTNDFNFTIKGAVVLNTPSAANITMRVGEPYNITWTKFGAVQFVNLYYSTEGDNGPWNNITMNISSTPSIYSWQVNDSIGSNVRVKIVDAGNPNNVYNISAHNFTILGKLVLEKPDVGEPDWIYGTQKEIRWKPTGTWTSVKIEGSKNAFINESTTWTIATVDTGSSGDSHSHNITVGDNLTATAKIRISDADPARSADVTDTSTESFKIKGKLEIINPNSGSEVWVAGTQPTNSPVQWVRSGSIANISIEYSPDAGTNWFSVINSTDASNTSFSNWTVPESAVKNNKQAYVRITDISEPTVNDTNDNVFLIRGNVTMTHPAVVDDRLVVNSTYYVNWTKTGVYQPSDKVKIEYNTNDGTYKSTWSAILNSTGDAIEASELSFPMTVPDDLSSNVKVRITRNADPVNVPVAISPQVRIVGNLTITQPTEVDKWLVNESYTVKWQRQGSIANVTISYSTNNGSSWTFITYASGGSGDTGISWTVPNQQGIASAQAQIRVSDTSDSTVNDTSDTFSIIPKFIVNAPVAGQKYLANRETYILWDSMGLNTTGKVHLYYSTNDFNGTNGTHSVEYNVTNDGNYTWMVPDDLSETVKVRITYPEDEMAAYNTSGEFSIIPGLEVISPYSSEFDKWQVATIKQIKWNCTSANLANVKISYSIDSGGNYTYVINSSADNSGPANGTRTYNWSVNNTITAGFRVKVQDSNTNHSDIFNVSPYNSKIIGFINVTSPNGNETYTVNDNFTIFWDHNGSVPNVKVDISRDDFNNSIVILNNSTSNYVGRYDTQIPDYISDTVKVRVTDTADTDASDSSDTYFKIRGAFSVGAPVDGNRWPIGYNSTIVWNTTGNISRVKVIAYSTAGMDDMRFKYTVADPYVIESDYNTSIPNGQTNYSWIVPDNGTTTAKIRIVDYNDSTVYAESSGNFSFIGSFAVVQPNGAENLTAWSTYSINWVPTGSSITEAKILYSINNGSTWDPINETYNNTYLEKGNISVNSGGIITLLENETESITGYPVGSSVGSLRTLYSLNNGTNWTRITSGPVTIRTNATQNVTISVVDGIVNNNGSCQWIVPDNITAGFSTFIRAEDPNDPTVNDTSDAGFKIRGGFVIAAPVGGERWVTSESHTIAWNTTGSIGKAKIIYSRDDFNTSDIACASINCSPGYNEYSWTIPDPLVVYGINDSAIPVAIKVRILDYNDSAVYTDTPDLDMDYYNVNWTLRDFLTGLPIAGGLAVRDDSIGWNDTELGCTVDHPILHKTPYGTHEASWTHKDYGEATVNYTVSTDTNNTIYLESKIVHVWSATTEYSYEPETDKVSFRSYLVRDGSIAGARDENGTFHTIATNCTVEIYYANGTLIKELNTSDVSDAGFFSITWEDTNLSVNDTYSAITQIMTETGGRFRTPFMLNIIPTYTLYNVSENIMDKIDVPLRDINASLMGAMQNQTITIQDMMENQTGIIENKTEEMQDSINTTLGSFENRTYAAITSLESGALNITNASAEALTASAQLQSTAEKFSWKGALSPDPALVGDNVTLSIQGPAEADNLTLVPLLDIYSWDNKYIIQSALANNITITLTEANISGVIRVSSSAVYTYQFIADSRFTAGKAYTYIVSEPITGGMVTGSGMVESTSLSAIAGLAAAAPEAERVAKKALDAIKAVEAVVVSNDNINIAMTLKNLKESVESLPMQAAKEGSSTKDVSLAVNQISERLKKLVGEEGYDLKQMLGEALGESPTIKEVRKKTDSINSIVDLLLKVFEAKFGGVDSPIVSTSLQTGSVRFRIIVANPSKVKRQKVDIKNYMPEEIKPKDVLDSGGLDLEYDAEKSIYYVYKPNIELAPGEIRTFEVEVEDVWVVPDNKLNDLKNRVSTIMSKLEKTEYYEKAKEIADPIYSNLDTIARDQVDESVSRSQHIGIYRQNLLTLQGIKEDIAKMEKILVTAGGPPSPDMLAKTRVKADEPTKTMTWMVIFIIITFVGFMAAILFFTWQRQVQLTKDTISAARKAAFPEAGPDESGPKGKERDG